MDGEDYKRMHDLMEIAQDNPFSNVDDQDDEVFYSQVDSLRHELDILQCSVNALSEIYDQNLINHSPSQYHVGNRTTLIKESVRRIGDDIQKLSHVLPYVPPCSSREARVKINIHASLTKDYLELQKQFKSLQDEYKEEIQRLVELVEIHEFSNDNEKVNDARRVFLEKATALAKQYRKKHGKFLKMERSLEDVGWLFVDKCPHVEESGKTIDRIVKKMKNSNSREDLFSSKNSLYDYTNAEECIIL